MEIKYIKHDDIDLHKWDSCVHFAGNGNVYGYSWYLNQVCEEWDGLVEGNYESVFPLVFNNKIPGFPQLYQPQFAQQLGLYSVHVLSEKRMQAFLAAIPSHFKRIRIQLNERNRVPEGLGFEVEERPNLQINLSKDYEDLWDLYSSNHKRNVKKAAKNGLRPINQISPEKLVELFKTHQGKQIPDLTERSYYTILRIIYQAQHRGLGFITGVVDKENELVAAAFFLISHGKLINLIPTTTPRGRELCAMHFLLDILIQTNSPSHKILDFEGSAIPSIARFYEGFGATLRPYKVIKRNRLPFFLRWALR